MHPDNYKEDIQEEDQESSEEEIPESILEQFNFEDFAPFASDKEALRAEIEKWFANIDNENKFTSDQTRKFAKALFKKFINYSTERTLKSIE